MADKTEEGTKKPVQKKCIGFSRKVGNTTFKVSCFYKEGATETIESKIKRLIEQENEPNEICD